MNHRLIQRCAPFMLAMLGTAAASAAAAGYPERPITLVVPFGAGGITDLVARAAGNALSAELNQTIVIENRPGAGGNIAASYLTRAQPDGYTLMFTTMGIVAVNPHTAPVNFDTFNDFTFISTVASTPHVIVVRSDLEAETLDELIELARSEPEALSFGTAGIGSSPFQGMEIIQQAEDLQFLHVPFKSGAESVQNVVSGEVDLTLEATSVVMPFVNSGRLRAIALANPERLDSAADVPSTAELGYPGVVSRSVSGLIAPAGVPDDIIRLLNEATRRALAKPEFQATLLAQGTATAASTPEAFREEVEAEYEKWGAILSASAVANQ